jgi:hypothetical protein
MSGADDYADLRSGPKMYGDMGILVYCIGILVYLSTCSTSYKLVNVNNFV